MNWLRFGLGFRLGEVSYVAFRIIAGFRAVKILIFTGNSETSNEVGDHRSDRFAGWHNLHKGLP